jgi:FixJ family two-component response regulator
MSDLQLEGKMSSAEAIGLLLVDDEPDALTELTDLFRKKVPLLQTAPSLEEAKRILAADPRFGVVLTDIRMPGGSGLELLEVARLRPDKEAVKVVVLTGYGNVDHTLAALRSRAFDFLIKPASRESILNSVSGAMEEVRVLRGGAAADTTALNAILRNRAIRKQVFKGRDLPDIAWDILLQLALARTRGEVLDISGLCGFIDATRTSVWRRLGELAELGLITRNPDPGDARRVMLEITDEPFTLIVEMALRKSI